MTTPTQDQNRISALEQELRQVQLQNERLQMQLFHLVNKKKIMNTITVRGWRRYRYLLFPAGSQWKLTRSGLNVCSFEPCTTHEAPRAELRRQGLLRELAPGESVSYEVEIGVL